MTPELVSGADAEVLFHATCGEHCQRSHREMITIQDGPATVFVDVCKETGSRRVFCGCHGTFRTEMVSIPMASFSEGVTDGLTCPICKWTLTFDIE
jgi:hypothetical protein